MKKIFYTIMSLALIFNSCQTIEDRESVGPLGTKSELVLSAGNTTTVKSKKGNELYVNNATPNTGGQWNMLVKISTKRQDTVVVPFLGKLRLPFIATTGGGLVYDTLSVQVDTLDHPVNPNYIKLAGNDVNGKTWVWATDNNYRSADKNFYWGVSSSNDAYPQWWGLNLSEASTKASDQKIDVAGTMTFDLNGAANFKKTEFGVISKGSFSFDFSKKKTKNPDVIGELIFTNTTIQRGISQNNDQKVVYVFEIVKLTDDELILMYPTDGKENLSEGWFWVFKRQGYVYP